MMTDITNSQIAFSLLLFLCYLRDTVDLYRLYEEELMFNFYLLKLQSSTRHLRHLLPPPS